MDSSCPQSHPPKSEATAIIMKPKSQIDQLIDDHLKDLDTMPKPGFTAEVLKQASEDRLVQEPVENLWFQRWFLVPLAAALVIGLWLLPNNPSDSNGIVANDVNAGEPQDVSLTEMEEILTMEESLRDFEILFDDDALEILALLEE